MIYSYKVSFQPIVKACTLPGQYEIFHLTIHGYWKEWAMRSRADLEKSTCHSHSQVQRGVEERLQSSHFPVMLFSVSTVKTCFWLQKRKERWNKRCCPSSLPGISISHSWDDSATGNDPGKSNKILQDDKQGRVHYSKAWDSAKGWRLQQEQHLNDLGKTSCSSWIPGLSLTPKLWGGGNGRASRSTFC